MFKLKEKTVWHGYPCEIRGKTYGPVRLYVIRLEDGSEHEVAENQLGEPSNILPFHKEDR